MGNSISEVRRHTRRSKEHSEGPESYWEMSFPVLEQFWWKRIVLDEFHELEAVYLTKMPWGGCTCQSFRDLYAYLLVY